MSIMRVRVSVSEDGVSAIDALNNFSVLHAITQPITLSIAGF